MKFKKICVAILACMMSFGVFSTTAFAYVDENAVQEEPVVEEKEQEKEPEEPMEPLTPDGNMTLVDDEGNHPESGKQFITAVTKNGNYFYIIIDRDDKGNQTVHFLNQVDEADLLKLMDEKEAASLTKPEEKPIPEPEVAEPTPEVDKPSEAEKPKVNMIPVVIALAALGIGGGFFLFKKVKESKKEKEAAKPDPDADYVDDEEDYGYVEEDEENVDYSDEEDNEPL